MDNAQLDPTKLVKGALKRVSEDDGAVNKVVDFADKNPETVKAVMQLGREFLQSFNTHSRRKHEARLRALSIEEQRRAEQAQPTQPEIQVPPFQSLPPDERLSWMSRGGEAAYYAQMGAPPAPQAPPTPQPPMMNTPSSMPMPTGGGNANLAEAHGAAGLQQLRNQIGGQPPIQTPPEPEHEPNHEPAPAPTMHETTDEEEQEMPQTTDVEAQAIQQADALIKEQQAQQITRLLQEADQEVIREFIEHDVDLMNATVAMARPLLPEKVRHNPVVKSLQQQKIKDLLPIIPEDKQAILREVRPSVMIQYARERLPEVEWIHDAPAGAYLEKQLNSLARTLHALAGENQEEPEAEEVSEEMTWVPDEPEEPETNGHTGTPVVDVGVEEGTPKQAVQTALQQKKTGIPAGREGNHPEGMYTTDRDGFHRDFGKLEYEHWPLHILRTLASRRFNRGKEAYHANKRDIIKMLRQLEEDGL